MLSLLTDRLPFHFYKNKPSRFGLLPRYADNEAGIRWFELPGTVIFHTANAWQVLVEARSVGLTSHAVFAVKLCESVLFN